MIDSPAIGIDLGTVYSCVGVWNNTNHHVEIIPNDQGNNTTPSYVAFTDTERLIGDAAFNHVVSDPHNTIYNAKRFIGRRSDDPILQNDMKLWPFKIHPGPNNKPVVSVKYKGETKKFFAEQISAMVLSKMKESAEAFLNKPVKDAVITVPAFFNDSQRQATKDAGTIAGLNVLGIINEPTASAIAYGLDKKSQTEKKVLIYDLGGGTFDVSLVSIVNDTFEVKASAGDTHLGGEDFDNKLVEYCVSDFAHKKGQDISKNSRALRRLRLHCERAKRILSSSTQTLIEVDSLSEAEDYNCLITRSKFEELCLPLFQKTILLVEQVLKDTGLSKNQINDVVLVGGCTRIPMIHHLLTDFFDGKEPNRSINPDEAVASGVAIKAAIMTGQCSQQYQDLVIKDITALSKGIQTGDNVMTVLIPRNTPLPTKVQHLFSTCEDNQSAVDIKVFEGERPLATDNHLIASFSLEDIPPAPRGEPQIIVTYEIDADGILNISACDKFSGKSNQVTIGSDSGRLSRSDIEEMIGEAELYKQQDDLVKQRVEARTELESYCYSINNALEDEKLKDKFDQNEREVLKDACDFIVTWIEDNEEAGTEDYIRKKNELEVLYLPILNRICEECGIHVESYLIKGPMKHEPNYPDVESH